MNEADEALSRSARASTKVPSGALTSTRQVINNEFAFIEVLVCDEMTSLLGITAAGVELRVSDSVGTTIGVEVT